MRTLSSLNQNWFFTMEDIEKPLNNAPDGWEKVNVPHTWNNLDGQDGGTFYRNSCWYFKKLEIKKEEGKCYWLEFQGVNSIAHVYVNETLVAHHEGGYSTFRADITDCITGNDFLWVCADNKENVNVYPNMADFTFYGGIYRDVNLIEVSESHFDLGNHGDEGITVLCNIKDDGSASVNISTRLTNAKDEQKVCFKVYDAENACVAEGKSSAQNPQCEVLIENPRLWNGKIDPHLYTVTAELVFGEASIDNIKTHFGIRTYSVDPETGFVLNGKPYHLHGVSRHQDRENKGNAISKADHEEDIKLIAEVGATTIRLAHYQHDKYFYELCDKYGLVIWAEIPFISMFEPTAQKNTISQMTELVLQNINHPSICFWGISNEITIGGEEDQNLYENLCELNELCKKLDPTRMTTIAHVSMVDLESPMHHITDVISYNHYFGWYGGDVSENGPWLDEFHKLHPSIPLGVSEYGAEGVLLWHTDKPECRDYTEEYQAYYHHEMLKTFATRPYLWSTHVWNMFDFGSDFRDEGGVQGRNNKGLVTFDRKTKKDSFFIYKAFWSEEKFVHICGRRYVNRVAGTTTITVYSNCDKVELNGISVEGKDKAFVFENIPLALGENTFVAKGYCGDKLFVDTIVLNGVETPDESYILKEEVIEVEGGGVANWFDGKAATSQSIEIKEGFLSIKDKISELMEYPEATEIFTSVMAKSGFGNGNGMNKGMMKMISNMPLEVLLKLAGKKVPSDAKFFLNEALSKIAKK